MLYHSSLIRWYVSSPIRNSYLSILPDNNVDIFDASLLILCCNFSSLILSSIVVINFYLSFFLKRDELSDARRVLEQEINIDNYKILRCDRNRHGGWVACYIRNDLSYNILSVFPCEIENIFFKILLPNSKPVIVGTIYCPPSQNNFLELLNSNMNKINPIDNEIYILGDIHINLFLTDSYVLEKIISKIASQFQMILKATMNFVHFLD